MKKTYQIPTIEIIKMQTAQMIAVSTELYGKEATGEAMGRSDSAWDDEY